MNESRKRRRPDDDDFSVQLKYYVNERLVEKSNKNLMSGVYGKHLIHLSCLARAV